ncbi:MAG: hypothetical protein ABJC09_02830 [Terriglobia bacterium]
MKVHPSTIPGVAIHGPQAQEFRSALGTILGHEPQVELQPAIPFSVMVSNNSARAVAFLGVRFDLLDARGKRSSVVHYADTLRYPEAADFRPGARRFVCAEPAYTALVMRGEPITARGRMNLDNLRRMLQVRATVDCVVFDDGEFAGPDSERTFDRLTAERVIEAGFLAELEAAEDRAAFLATTAGDSRERVLQTAARKILDGKDFRLRIPISRRHERPAE